MSPLLALALATSLATSLGCTGELRGGDLGSDAALEGNDAGRDAAMNDGGSTDAGPVGGEAGFDGGNDAGFDAGPVVGPCDVGYTGSPGACTPVESEPTTRSADEVCEVWRAGNTRGASGSGWTEGASACEVGTLDPAAIADTIRMVNTYRWLSGLPPVEDDPSWFDRGMECALMMTRNNTLNHTPPSSWTCYTSGGADMAGSSNLSLGYADGPAGVTGQMWDRSTPSLGHRRWILSPDLGRDGVGVAGRALCLRVFDGSGSTSRTWTAYPNPGFAPLDNAGYAWSIQLQGASFAGASVSVTRQGDAASLSVTSAVPGGGYGRWPAISFTPSGWTPSAGETYEVSLAGHGSSAVPDPLVYSVSLVDC